MIHPIERYHELKGWIPETDIDGIDAKKEYASYCKNVDFENGFLQGCIAPSSKVLPALVSNAIIAGYDILDSKYFYHSVKGNIIFFVLWETTTSSAKYFVWEVDTNTTTELLIDKQGAEDVTYATKPSIISWGLAEDQLKINLNITVTYNKIVFSPILNLTLIYIPTLKEYITGSIKFDAGWYLFPRWLGWSYGDIDVHTTANIYFLNDTPNFSYPAINTSNGFRHTDPKITWFNNGYGDSFYDYVFHANPGQTATLRIEGFCNIGQISYEASSAVSSSITVTVKDATTGATILVDTRNMNSSIINPLVDVYKYSDGFIIEFSWDSNVLLQRIFFRQVQWGRSNYPDSTWRSSVIVVAKYMDGQRALLYNPNISEIDDIGVENTLYLYVNNYAIDWRITEYELYGLDSVDNNIYYLIGSVKVDGTWIAESGSVSKKRIQFAMSVTTLNFNYGLGSTVRADTQSLIYDEVNFKARTYFIKNDYKVYQSHISGTGRVQPDSFPYDESVEFGYFVTGRDDINLALAVTNLEELLIIGKARNYLYYIEGQAGTVFRTLKKNEGGKSILSIKSLVKGLSGSPMAEVLFWTDNYGAYIYGGGRETPKNIMVVNLRNYWKALGNYKNTAVAFYNEARNEFWIAVKDEVIVYELSFGVFKRYELGFRIKSYLGENNGIHYFLTYDNEVRVLDTTSNVRMDWEVETHYNANTVIVERYPIEAPEHESKILQEIYIAVKDRTSSIVKYIITTDGNEYPEITMITGVFTDILPAPLLIRYGKVKIKLKASKAANLREFGYSFTVPNQEPYQQVKVPIQGIGMSSGKDAGIGL